MKRGPGWGVVACNVETQCQNLLYFCPDHWGGPFGPRLHEPSSYIIQTEFASNKSHFRTFAQLTPSAKIVLIKLGHPFCIGQPANSFYIY